MLVYFSQIISILGSVLTATKASTGDITPIIEKVVGILGLLGGLTTPDTIEAAIADLKIVVAAAQSEGVLTGDNAVTEALAIMEKFEVVKADYLSGQVAMISSNFSAYGVPGYSILVSKYGPAAQTLGL